MALDFEKFIGRATLMLPAIHFTTCALYMAGYAFGFGSDIGGMFSATDFFTITIQYLVSTYVLGLGIPLFVILMRYRHIPELTPDRYNSIDPQPPTKKTIFIAKSLLYAAPIFLLLLGFLLLLLQTWVGAIHDYRLSLLLIIMGSAPIWWLTFDKLQMRGLPSDLGWCLAVFAGSVLGLGMNIGERDRRLPFKEAGNGHMYCGNHIILSPIGSNFISVTQDNRRHLIDDECKVKFDFPEYSIAKVQSLAVLIQDELANKTE